MKKLWVILLLTALFISPELKAEGTVKFTGAKIVEVKIEGLMRVSSYLVRETISFKKGDRFDPFLTGEDVKNLYETGFFDDVVVKAEKKEDGIILIYQLKEKKYLRKVLFEGMKKLKKEDVQKKLSLKPGRFFDRAKLNEDIRELRKMYEEKGYFLVNIEPQIKDLGENAVSVIFKINEGKPVKVKRIIISGNKHISDEEIKSIMRTREAWLFGFITGAGKYESEKIKEDLERIRYYYMDKGFLRVEVGDPVIEISPDRKYLYITIPVEEGERYFVRSVDVEGNIVFSKEYLLTKMRVKEGEHFSRTNVALDILMLTRTFEDMGYAYANVEPLIRPDDQNKKVDITYRIEPGGLVYINRIDITGNTKTRDKVIRREIRLAEGDLYSSTLINFSKSRLMATGFFKDVKIKTKPQGEGIMNLEVEVEEGRTGTLTAGVGFSSFENFMGTFQASFGNFLGYGQRVRMNFEISSRRKDFALSFLDNYFLDTDWSFGVDAYSLDQNYIDFTRRAYGGVLRIGRLLTDFTRFYLSYRLEKVRVADISGSGISSLFQAGWTSNVSFDLVRDTKNHPYDPSKGQYSILSATLAGKFLGGDFDYVKAELGHQIFINPLWKFVIMLGVKLKMGYELNGGRLPFAERYFAGGIYTVRGYDYNQLSPQTRVLNFINEPYSYTRDIVYGGNKLFIINTELLFPILEQAGIKGVIFFDAGRAYAEEEPLDPRRLRMGWGFGIRWFTPIAPFRFEWGFPIHRRPGERPMVFEFSIGTFF